MRASHYATALFELSQGKDGGDKLVKNFVQTVAQNGHAHLLPKIAKALENIVAREEKKNTIEVVAEKMPTEAEVVALLKKEPWKRALNSSHKHVVRKTDPTLIGGILVRTGTTKIDGSYKRTLIDLYQSLISN